MISNMQPIISIIYYLSILYNGEVLTTKNSQVSFFSETPIENIKANSNKLIGVYDLRTNDLQFGVNIKSFVFDKELMQEHFNENYLESDKYPFAKFKGKIDKPIDITKPGEYDVLVTGDIEIHGVSVKRKIPGKIRVSNSTLTMHSVFDVKCADHNIKIPSIVFKNIGETIRVTINAKFEVAT